MRAVPEEVDVARNEKCEFLPFCNPKEVIVRDGKIVAIEFYKTEKGISVLVFVNFFFSILRKG